ncbi:Uu.00g087890.m01.CDS01 [Anthostomella pinea]|uniref:Uu.00g087890.m01.CDS01 n=1 Tax=Anthostomella pinea TaxID=933095 RepID=A0AAI8VMI4_9PEZI|nr:Uu.00g087890.m01.CDS01 [Anthostomella pinea]
MWTDYNVTETTAPELVHYDNIYRSRTYQAAWAHVGIAVVFVALRIWYRSWGPRKLWVDDSYLVLALACLVANAVMVTEWVQLSWDENAPPYDVVLTGSLMGTFNSMSLAFGKTSLALTLIRLTDGWWRTCLWYIILLMNMLYLIQAISFWLRDCKNQIPEPLRLPATDCMQFNVVKFARIIIQAASCATDAFFSVVPWKIVQGLDLRRYEKIGLAVAMSLGVMSLASGLMRIVDLVRLTAGPGALTPFYIVVSFVWNLVEPADTIFACCMPVLRKIIVDMLQWKPNNHFAAWLANRRRNERAAAQSPSGNVLLGGSGNREESPPTSGYTSTSGQSVLVNGEEVPIADLEKRYIGLPRVA